MRPVILIPAYKPSEQLITLVSHLDQEYKVVVVDDGSGKQFRCVFFELEKRKNVHVLHHAINLGKGEALKTGFNYCLNHFSDAKGVVTADADGQHLVEDIFKIAQCLQTNSNQLHLGARAFDKQVPLRSQFGNILTRHIFRFLLGTKLQDTQTGLRGIPQSFLPTLLHTKSRGYDFELDMLVLAHKHKIAIKETTITTVYEDNNESSHFNPILDSVKIYYVFFRFLFFAIISGIIDVLAFMITYYFIQHIFLAETLARIFSGTCNFLFNKELVFRSKNAIILEALKYTLLCLVNLIFSFGLITSLVYLGLNVYASKIIALIGLFFANFAIQKLFIFQEPETETPA
jgi:glycosyltransferase involved in cell wall biosynthesis